VTRLYHNVTGQLNAYVASMEEYRGRLEQRLRTAEQAAQALQARASQSENRVASLQQQVEGLPELQQQASQVDALQEQVNKLNLLMHYPQVVNRFVEREEQGAEGEEPRRVRANPTLELLLTSTLSGEQFAQHVQDFVQTLPLQGQQPTAPSPEAGASLTPQPANQQDERWARYNELRDQGRYNEALDVLMEGMEH